MDHLVIPTLVGSMARSSHQSDSQQSRERSNKTMGRHSDKDRHRHSSSALDAMSRALWRVVRSPFSDEIEHIKMPRHFNPPPFYDSKTDRVEHVSHYIQLMSLYSRNDSLMCKVFSSSLWPTAMRWFNDLRKESIHNLI